MGALSRATQKATPRFEDVLVLLDGALLAERDVLLEAARVAEREDKLDPREGMDRAADAIAAVHAFDERLAESFVTIRVFDVGSAKWHGIKLANPMNADKDARSIHDQRAGFDVKGAARDAVEAGAQIVTGVDELETPAAAEWPEFWAAINAGDEWRIAQAVTSVHESSGIQGYAFAKKA